MNVQNQIIRFRKYSTTIEDFDKEESFLAVLTCVQESYQLSKNYQARQLVYIVTPVSRHPEGEQLLRQNSSTENLMANHNRKVLGGTLGEAPGKDT